MGALNPVVASARLVLTVRELLISLTSDSNRFYRCGHARLRHSLVLWLSDRFVITNFTVAKTIALVYDSALFGGD
jgi:hypothetical protein